MKRANSKGDRVYISCAANGEIGFHEGWLDAKEAAKGDKAKARAEAKSEPVAEIPDPPELTGAAIRYLDLHRQNAVRAELLKAPQMALRLLVASVISGRFAPKSRTPSATKRPQP